MCRFPIFCRTICDHISPTLQKDGQIYAMFVASVNQPNMDVALKPFSTNQQTYFFQIQDLVKHYLEKLGTSYRRLIFSFHRPKFLMLINFSIANFFLNRQFRACVCLCVCLQHAGIVSKPLYTDRTGFFAYTLPSTF